MHFNEQFFRSVFDALPSNIAIFGETGEIILVNHSWKEFAHTNGVRDLQECCEGANYLDITYRASLEGAEDAALALKGLQKVLDGEKQIFTMDYECPSLNSCEWYELLATPIPGTKLVITVHKKITERIQSIKLRDECIATVAHDLKTPLQGILSMSELSLKHIDDKNKLAKRLTAIQRNCQRINTMVAELSEAAYLASGLFKLSEEELDLGALLRKARETFSDEFQSRIVMVMPSEPVVVLADRNRMMRVMENLLSNALKFSYSDKPVRVTLNKEEKQAIVKVVDEGVGISPEDLPHIFERYYRGKTSAGREGLGLGLHISRMIVLSHKGVITVQSEVGKGSTFCITLSVVE